MYRSALTCFALALFAVHINATAVGKCKGTKVPAPKSEDVTISDCDKPPCRLRKRTEPIISMKIRPENDVQGLTTQVSAEIGTIPFPFIGVDGTSACGNIFSEDGKTKLGCPLKAGNTYLYRNSFKILDLYPKISINIHWGLVDSKTKQLVDCFELPARIG